MKKTVYFIGVLFASVLLTGCHSVYKSLRIEPFDFYRTDLNYINLTPDFSIKYPTQNQTLIRIEDPPEYARLAADLGSGMGYHGYTNKAMLPAWNILFDRFLAWKPSTGSIETVSDAVETKKYSGYLSKEVKFVNVGGVKYLVFITHYLLTPDILMAYDEENVIKMKHLYQSLNATLIDK